MGVLLGVLGVGAAPGANAQRRPNDDELPAPRVVVTEVAAEDATCGVTVRAEGLPAISTDGTHVVFEAFSLAGDAEVQRLQWRPTRPGGIAHALDIDRSDWLAADDAASCRRYTAALERAATGVNAMLDQDSWRPLEELHVVLAEPDADDGRALDPMSIEPNERPVQVRWTRGRLVVRTPGVQTYVNASAPWSTGDAPELYAVFGDADTGTLLVSHGSDDGDEHGLAHAPPALFERLAKLAEPPDRRRG